MIISATIRKAGPSKAWERRKGGREASEFPSCRGGGGGRRGRGGGRCWSTNWTPAAWQYNYGLLPRARGCVCVCACVSRGFGPWREHAIPALRGFFDRPVEKLASCRHPLRPSAISLPFLVLSGGFVWKKESKMERKLDDVVGVKSNRSGNLRNPWIRRKEERIRFVSCSISKKKKL